jgi:hypothetical protein
MQDFRPRYRIKKPSPWVAHNLDSQQHLAFSVKALWSTTTAGTGHCTTARGDCAQARGEQVHRRSAVAPSCSRARSTRTTSYLRGPRSPDWAQAAQIEPARVSARKLAGLPAAPGRCTTLSDPRRCSCPTPPPRRQTSSTSPHGPPKLLLSARRGRSRGPPPSPPPLAAGRCHHRRRWRRQRPRRPRI